MVPESKTPAVSEVAVCKVTSLLVQNTVLFFPITTVVASGEYPKAVFAPPEYPCGGVPAPLGIVTLTHFAEGQVIAGAVEVVVVLVCFPATSNW
jgi:hypothetical protein